jgi:hypothetical protein
MLVVERRAVGGVDVHCMSMTLGLETPAAVVVVVVLVRVAVAVCPAPVTVVADEPNKNVTLLFGLGESRLEGTGVVVA